MKKLLIAGILLAGLVPSMLFADWGTPQPETNVVSVAATPTINTGIYASGDLVGTKMSFASMPVDGIIQSVVMYDLGKQDASLDLILFRADPSGTTFTNNAALDIVDADMAKIIAVVQLASYIDLSDNSYTFKGNLATPYDLNTGDTIYGCLVSRATPTYTSVADLVVTLSAL